MSFFRIQRAAAFVTLGLGLLASAAPTSPNALSSLTKRQDFPGVVCENNTNTAVTLTNSQGCVLLIHALEFDTDCTVSGTDLDRFCQVGDVAVFGQNASGVGDATVSCNDVQTAVQSIIDACTETFDGEQFVIGRVAVPSNPNFIVTVDHGISSPKGCPACFS